MTKKEVAQHIFKTYPNQDEAFITSDKRGFLEAHTADAYAARLADRKISKYNRNDDAVETIKPTKVTDTIKNTAAAVGTSPKTAAELAKDHKAETDKAAADKAKDLEVVTDTDETPLEDLKFDELKALAEKEGANIEGMRSKEDVRQAITENREEKAKAEIVEGTGDGNGTGAADETQE